MGIDGRLDLIWNAYIRYLAEPQSTPWGVIGQPQGLWYGLHEQGQPGGKVDAIRPNGWVLRKPSESGWYWDAYPALSPFYPIPTVAPEWIDAWSMQDFHGYWW